MPDAPAFEYLLRRDRVIVMGGLVGVVLLSGLYILNGAGMDMEATDGAMSMAPSWSPDYFVLMLVMWAVMMAAMMLPSAAPMILLYAAIARRRPTQTDPVASTGLFALGYVAIWSAFSLAATMLQWRLDAVALLSPMMMTTNVVVAGSVLIAAGIYQWTPLKRACLRRCQSPLDFILGNWRGGKKGALVMGLRHGAFCLGCCWMLMLLLFVGGVMNLLWIAGIALFVLIEKLAPGGERIGYAAGAVLVAWGGWTLSAAFV